MVAAREAAFRGAGRAGRDPAPAGPWDRADRAGQPRPLHAALGALLHGEDGASRRRAGAAAPGRPGRRQPHARPRRRPTARLRALADVLRAWPAARAALAGRLNGSDFALALPAPAARGARRPRRCRPRRCARRWPRSASALAVHLRRRRSGSAARRPAHLLAQADLALARAESRGAVHGRVAAERRPPRRPASSGWHQQLAARRWPSAARAW